ncbi:MAG TPA: NAD-dependent epimerase/dehydratase family protein [Myxococcaceae bacterium]|nr:NAD-dependent epimerase/dehydratase family protein [Myxococcaceae bacterium]
MRVLVTGGTGLVGHGVAKALVARGHEVRTLVRDPGRAATLLPAGVTPVTGDITRPDSLGPALAGVEWLFHSAGLPEQWQRDESVFDRVNRQGTAWVLGAARAAGVRRVVYTSTGDVFAAPRGGMVTEGPLDPVPKRTAYERSKVAAEREVEAVRSAGLDVVVLNPAATYGPAPVVSGLNAAIVKQVKGKVPLLPPGGTSVVYVDGLAEAHVLAAERGRSGERYLIADGYLALPELAREIARLVPGVRVPPVAPEWVLRGATWVSAALARVFRFVPPIAPGELEFVLWQARLDASKAVSELGFRQTPVDEGLRRTVEHLRAQGAFG